jgi:periplasmic divalent cation tolerance protein
MRIVLITVPADAAERISEILVGERLAACVSRVEGVRSVYRWKGAVERAEEVQLVVKTSESLVSRLAARTREIHPYELPEIVSIAPDWVLPEYDEWVREETRNA